MNDVFKNRCENDPQGVIKDLLEQTTLQAQEIRQRDEFKTAFLTQGEAVYLLQLISSQPTPVSRDFAAEEMSEALKKKLQTLATPPVPKKKKK